MIITKEKKLYSLLGAILITLSPAIQWWQTADIQAYGLLAVLLFYKFMQSDSTKKKMGKKVIKAMDCAEDTIAKKIKEN